MTNDIERKKTLSVSAFAKELGVSRTHAYNLVERGEIPVIRLGHRVVIPGWYVEQLLNRPQAENA